MEWVQLAEDPTIPYLNILAAVGAGKSTTLGLCFLLRRVVFDRTHRTIVASKAEGGVARDTVKLLGDNLRFNPKLVLDFGKFYDPELPWTNSKLTVIGHDPISKDPNFKAVGRAGSIEGMRAHLIYYDDPFDLKTELSPPEQQFGQMWMLHQMKPRLEPGGKIVAAGAPWFKEDSWEWFAKQPRVRVVKYPAIYPDGRLLWPGKWTREALELLQSDNADVFAARYLLEPASLTGDMIKRAWLRYWKDDAAPPRARLFVVMGIDLAAGKETSKSQSVVTVVGRDQKTWKILVLAQFAAPLNMDVPTFMLDHVKPLYDQWAPEGGVAVEDAGQQWEVVRPYLAQIPHLVPQKPTEGTAVPQKLLRIQRTLQPLIQNGTMEFHDTMSEGLVYCLLRLPRANPLDPADSLEIATRRLLAVETKRPAITRAGPPMAAAGIRVGDKSKAFSPAPRLGPRVAGWTPVQWKPRDLRLLRPVPTRA